MYEYIIIGGGISGLYCSLNLTHHKVLLLEANNYLGGRIFTNKNPQYEIGAGRYNENHKILISLIKQYKLSPIKLSHSHDFIYNNTTTNDVDILFKKTINQLLAEPKLESLRDISFYNYIRKFFTKTDSDKMMYIFGYYSEFKVMNAYDSLSLLKKTMNGDYYVVKEGLSELIKRMSKGLNYKLNHKVKHIEHNDGIYKVDQYFTKNIIFTIPANNLKQFVILKPILPLINSVKVSSLLRVYAIYKNKWFADMPRTTTNSFLRHIIPINSNTGLIMISYVEGKDTEPYRNENGNLKTTKIIMNKIQKELKILFPDKDIQEPEYFKVHLWEVGDHSWLPKYNSDKISKEILNPIKGIYICGESFSHNQAWVEGALETSVKVLDILEQVHK